MFQPADIMDRQTDNSDVRNVMRWSENRTASLEICPGTVQGLPFSRQWLDAAFSPKFGPAVNAQPPTHFFSFTKRNFYTDPPWPKERKKLVQRTEEVDKEEYSSIRLTTEPMNFKKLKSLPSTWLHKTRARIERGTSITEKRESLRDIEGPHWNVWRKFRQRSMYFLYLKKIVFRNQRQNWIKCIEWDKACGVPDGQDGGDGDE